MDRYEDGLRMILKEGELSLGWMDGWIFRDVIASLLCQDLLSRAVAVAAAVAQRRSPTMAMTWMLMARTEHFAGQWQQLRLKPIAAAVAAVDDGDEVGDAAAAAVVDVASSDDSPHCLLHSCCYYCYNCSGRKCQAMGSRPYNSSADPNREDRSHLKGKKLRN